MGGIQSALSEGFEDRGKGREPRSLCSFLSQRKSKAAEAQHLQEKGSTVPLPLRSGSDLGHANCR